MAQPNVPGVDPQVQAMCDAFRRDYRAVHDEVAKVIVGHKEIIDGVLTCLFVGGHALLEGVPGLGKTALIRSLADALHLKFSRIQFTPDLMPADVIGTNVIMENATGNRAFQFMHGPIFAQIVLADEINRATAKTQSALLEAMEEHQVTVDGQTYPMYDPFLLIATQNPIEYEGTFPLPEAQLDRFLVRIQLGYPTPAEEFNILTSQQYEHPLQNTYQVVTVQELLAAQNAIREVYIADEVKRYIIDLVNASRQHPDVYLGSSPRGSLALFRTSQARAAMAGREYAVPDDVKALADVTLAHRIIVGPAARIKDISSRTIVQDVLASTPVPGASAWK